MPRILIVDDEPALLSLGKLILTMEGFQVETAGSAAGAMALCTAEQFDMVLSDIVMPDHDGHALVQWLAENHPSTRAALMSGYDAGRLGDPATLPCQFLRKPFLPAEMVAFVRRVLAAGGGCEN